MYKIVNTLRSKALNDLFVAGALGLVEADWEPGDELVQPEPVPPVQLDVAPRGTLGDRAVSGTSRSFTVPVEGAPTREGLLLVE